jgi:hypothetical protein
MGSLYRPAMIPTNAFQPRTADNAGRQRESDAVIAATRSLADIKVGRR